MAKASWLILTPDSGNGNGSIQNSATAHTGRTQRETTVTVTGVGASKPATYTVTQKAKAEFASFDDGIEMSAPKAGGKSTNNGADIEGDPGATEQYAFVAQLTFPANETTEEVDRVLKVTAKGGQEAQITIKQAAGDAFITVQPTSITLEADGTAVSVTVKSNTQWSAS